MQLRNELVADTDLADAVPLDVVDKGSQVVKTDPGLKSLLNYSGPDSNTTALLEAEWQTWTYFPVSFWAGCSLSDLSVLHPQAQIVGAYLQLNRRDA